MNLRTEGPPQEGGSLLGGGVGRLDHVRPVASLGRNFIGSSMAGRIRNLAIDCFRWIDDGFRSHVERADRCGLLSFRLLRLMQVKVSAESLHCHAPQLKIEDPWSFWSACWIIGHSQCR